MAIVPQHLKKIKYNYDLFSGKMNQIWYQPGAEDQFIQYFDYDADNRVTAANTSTFPEEPADLRDKDIQYHYYKHGPLARVELGNDKVQGLDFAYTINGWIKGMNSATLFPERDIGKDGGIATIHSEFAQDAYGFELGYYDDAL